MIRAYETCGKVHGGYAIKPQGHVITVVALVILLRIVRVHAVLDHLLFQRDQPKFLPLEVHHQLAEVEAEVKVVHLVVRV